MFMIYVCVCHMLAGAHGISKDHGVGFPVDCEKTHKCWKLSWYLPTVIVIVSVLNY